MEKDDVDALFLQWLSDNGAKFPKIDWPSSKTDSGIRGAIATNTIETNEPMIVIPGHLMMSPPIIFADPDIGQLLKMAVDVLHGDLLLAVYIMFECQKKGKSFYYPFLRILPEPGNVSEWTEEQLSWLQDDGMLLRAKGRQKLIKQLYSRSIENLNQRLPEVFPLEVYDYKLFKFAWNTVQARAFGKRLPWTALVPFADCLNHNNVQTKYDYDVDGNNMFRLFPSGSNCYPKSVEVYNSYGRRPNDNLLLDYGFSLVDNEWDEVEIYMRLADNEPNIQQKVSALFAIGVNSNKLFRLSPYEIPLEFLSYCRIVAADAILLQRVDEIDYEKAQQLASQIAAETAELEKSNEEIYLKTGDLPLRPNRNYERRKRCFESIISLANEIKAMTLVIGILQHTVSIRQTIVAEDEELLAVLDYMRLSAEHAGTGSEMKHDSVDVEKITLDEAFSYNQGDNDNYWRLLSSVNYRLTRKRIIDKVLKQLQDLQECLQSIEQAEATNSACTDSAKSYLHEIEKNAEIIRKSTSGLVKLKYQKALLAYLEAIRNPANRPTL